MSLAFAQRQFSLGHHAVAAPLFRQALVSAPAHNSAMIGHAGCTLESDGPCLALRWIDRCLAVDPLSPVALQNAIALARSTDDIRRLIAYVGREVAHRPADELLFLRGEAWQRLGNNFSAAHDYKAALTLNPNHPAAACNLGAMLTAAGQPLQAIAILRRSVGGNPTVPPLRLNLAYAALKAGSVDTAITQAQAGLAYRPDWPEAWVNLGIALDGKGSAEQATAGFARALAVDPLQGEAYAGEAKQLVDQGRHGLARPRLRIALALSPHLDWTHANQATAALAENDRVVVERSALRALTLDSRCALAQWALALMLLARGDYARGWPHFESRWRLPDFWAQHGRHFSSLLWDGGDVSGRRVLLWAEQGFGDALQFVRYAPLLAARGARVTLECPGPLVRLFTGLPGVEQVIARGEPLPEVDCHAPLMSLPYLFGTTLASIPAAVPYLAPPPGTPIHPALDEPGPRIGLVWAGSPAHKSDRARSLAPDDIRRLVDRLAAAGARLFSLQIGPRAADIAGTPVIDLAPSLGDFADTAAALARLDLVIAVDTAVAHLAGALSRPLLILLPHAAEWRWLTDRPDTPWYPSAQLLRQAGPGDWNQPIQDALRIAQQIPGRKL